MGLEVKVLPLMLARVVEFLRRNNSLRTPSCCLFIEKTKAFDTVDYTILLKKCYVCGLKGKFLLQSFLGNLSHYIKNRNHASCKKACKKASVCHRVQSWVPSWSTRSLPAFESKYVCRWFKCLWNRSWSKQSHQAHDKCSELDVC